MALRSLDTIPYIPLLGLKPAEMQALEELPQQGKEVMMPLIQLGPWATAHHLHSSIARLDEAYGDLPCFVSLAEVEPPETERPVHRQLSELRNSEHGYRAWCDFIENRNNFVPTLQLHDLSQLSAQATRLHRLARGLIVLVERGGFPGLDLLSKTIADATDNGADVCFMLDLGRSNQNLIMQELQVTNYIEEVLRSCGNAFVSVSSSSFPESFTSITNQEIYERSLFSRVQPYFGDRLIYSDRGSARAERQSGGGGIPAPRVDYATAARWSFYRSEEDTDRNKAYFQQARIAMESSDWDGRLRIWGTQMIERTALEDTSAIISPKRSTAARINIHLHRQTFYGDNTGLYNTDDAWSD